MQPLLTCEKPSRSRYRAGCRCDGCTTAHRDYMREYYRLRSGNKNRKRDVERAYIERVGTARSRYPLTSRAADERRRARKMGADSERFNAADVYLRDGWTCGICLQAVDPACQYPHPMSPSLDHIVPLSAGGPHTSENSRCSHLSCNVRRGNRT